MGCSGGLNFASVGSESHGLVSSCCVFFEKRAIVCPLYACVSGGMNLNIGNMRLFISVYETQSIARTSKEMFLSRQAVSKRIASIESELGAPLFTRVVGGTGGGIVPTQAGQDVYRSLKSIVAAYDEMLESIPSAGAKTETLRVAVEFYDMRTLNVEKVFEFERETRGRVAVDVKYCTNDDCYYRLINNQADVAIANEPLLRQPEFLSYNLCVSDAVVMMGATNPLASKEPLGLDDLAKQKALGIIGCEWTSRFIDEAFAGYGLSFKVENASFSTDSLVSLLLDGRGYHIAPEVFARGFDESSGIVVKTLTSFLPPFKLALSVYEKRPFKLYVDEFVKWFLANTDSILSDESGAFSENERDEA